MPYRERWLSIKDRRRAQLIERRAGVCNGARVRHEMVLPECCSYCALETGSFEGRAMITILGIYTDLTIIQ